MNTKVSTARAPSTAAILADLATRWPVGTRVEHTWSKWTGTVVPDDSGDHPGRTAGTAPAHAVVGTIPAVAVEWDVPAPVAWIRASWLRPLPPPAAASRTRRRTR